MVTKNDGKAGYTYYTLYRQLQTENLDWKNKTVMATTPLQATVNKKIDKSTKL